MKKVKMSRTVQHGGRHYYAGESYDLPDDLAELMLEGDKVGPYGESTGGRPKGKKKEADDEG
jgi:hypothetical protein